MSLLEMKNDEGDEKRASCQGCTLEEDLASPNCVWHTCWNHCQQAYLRYAGASRAALQHLAWRRSRHGELGSLAGLCSDSIPSSSARYLVECFSRRHGVDIELKRPPTTFANAAYTASPLTYSAVVGLDVHLQSVSSTVSSGFLRS
jgi:hypothetical protein